MKKKRRAIRENELLTFQFHHIVGGVNFWIMAWRALFFNVLAQWRVHSCPALFLKWVLRPPERNTNFRRCAVSWWLILQGDHTYTNCGRHCFYVLFWKWFQLNEVNWRKEMSIFIMYCLLFLAQRMKDEWPIKWQIWDIRKHSGRLCYVYKIIFNLNFCQVEK